MYSLERIPSHSGQLGGVPLLVAKYLRHNVPQSPFVGYIYPPPGQEPPEITQPTLGRGYSAITVNGLATEELDYYERGQRGFPFDANNPADLWLARVPPYARYYYHAPWRTLFFSSLSLLSIIDSNTSPASGLAFLNSFLRRRSLLQEGLELCAVRVGELDFL